MNGHWQLGKNTLVLARGAGRDQVHGRGARHDQSPPNGTSRASTLDPEITAHVHGAHRPEGDRQPSASPPSRTARRCGTHHRGRARTKTGRSREVGADASRDGRQPDANQSRCCTRCRRSGHVDSRGRHTDTAEKLPDGHWYAAPAVRVRHQQPSPAPGCYDGYVAAALSSDCCSSEVADLGEQLFAACQRFGRFRRPPTNAGSAASRTS